MIPRPKYRALKKWISDYFDRNADVRYPQISRGQLALFQCVVVDQTYRLTSHEIDQVFDKVCQDLGLVKVPQSNSYTRPECLGDFQTLVKGLNL